MDIFANQQKDHNTTTKQGPQGRHVKSFSFSVKVVSFTVGIILVGVFLVLFLHSYIGLDIFELRTVPIYQKRGRWLKGKGISDTYPGILSGKRGLNHSHMQAFLVPNDDILIDSSTLVTELPNLDAHGINVEELEAGINEEHDMSVQPPEWDELHKRLYSNLDPYLNPDVNTSLPLREGFVLTSFDARIFDLQNKYVVLHQTWKDTCILETKKKYMNSWLQREENLKVVFWTDSLMESWVLERFSGTYIYEAWLIIAATRDAHIKKADIFRAMLMWYYGGVYADLDIKLTRSLKDFLKEQLTVIVWEPEESMLKWTEYEEGSLRKTLVLSGFLISGHRFSAFLGFYINWIAKNHLSGRSKWEDHVIDATGPRVEAEAYYYYIGRIKHHDRLLHAQTYKEFLNYGEHFSETTWVLDTIKDIGCIEIQSVYDDLVLVMGQPS